MACFECNLAEKGLGIAKEKQGSAFLHVLPATIGHTIVIPQQHYPILESVPNEILENLAPLTKKVSQVLFDALECQGTNILIHNGTSAGQESSHLTIHVLPRRQGDGLNFGWRPQSIPEAYLNQFEEALKTALRESTKVAQHRAVEELKSMKETDSKRSYQIHHLRRIP